MFLPAIHPRSSYFRDKVSSPSSRASTYNPAASRELRTRELFTQSLPASRSWTASTRDLPPLTTQARRAFQEPMGLESPSSTGPPPDRWDSLRVGPASPARTEPAFGASLSGRPSSGSGRGSHLQELMDEYRAIAVAELDEDIRFETRQWRSYLRLQREQERTAKEQLQAALQDSSVRQRLQADIQRKWEAEVRHFTTAVVGKRKWHWPVVEVNQREALCRSSLVEEERLFYNRLLWEWQVSSSNEPMLWLVRAERLARYDFEAQRDVELALLQEQCHVQAVELRYRETTIEYLTEDLHEEFIGFQSVVAQDERLPMQVKAGVLQLHNQEVSERLRLGKFEAADFNDIRTEYLEETPFACFLSDRRRARQAQAAEEAEARAGWAEAEAAARAVLRDRELRLREVIQQVQAELNITTGHVAITQGLLTALHEDYGGRKEALFAAASEFVLAEEEARDALRAEEAFGFWGIVQAYQESPERREIEARALCARLGEEMEEWVWAEPQVRAYIVEEEQPAWEELIAAHFKEWADVCSRCSFLPPYEIQLLYAELEAEREYFAEEYRKYAIDAEMGIDPPPLVKTGLAMQASRDRLHTIPVHMPSAPPERPYLPFVELVAGVAAQLGVCGGVELLPLSY
eukprot:EG_transcript_4897